MSASAHAAYGAMAAWVALAGFAALWRVARAARRLRRGRGALPPSALPPMHPTFQQPFSVLVVADDANAGADTIAHVAALLALDYSEHEVVVVTEGSQGHALAALEEAFSLEVFPEAHWRRLPAQPVRAIYHAARDTRLRVVDKEAGGATDALNCAINASRFPLVAVVEPGVTLRRDALQRLAEPFVADGATLAACSPATYPGASPAEQLRGLRALLEGIGGAMVRGMAGAPRGVLALRKDAVVDAGGFRLDAVDPPLDLLLRQRARLAHHRARAAMAFITEPVCKATGAAVGNGATRVPWEAAATLAAYAVATMLWIARGIDGAALVALFAMGASLSLATSAAALALEAAYFQRLLATAPLGRLAASAIFSAAWPFRPGRARWKR